jgi:beta-lactamase regulating signal transducer with metallopeptidase domain
MSVADLVARGAELTRASGAPLINHLWEATLFAAALLLLLIPLRRAPARTRCRLYFLASLKFAVPSAAVVWLAGALGARVGSLAPLPASALSVLRADSWASAAAAALARWLPAGSGSGGAEPLAASGVALGLAAVWLGGAALLAAGHLWRRRGIAREVAAARPLADGVGEPAQPAGEGDRTIATALAAARHRVGLRREVEVRLSTALGSPGVWGVVRPVLLLPEGIAAHLTPAELDAVLLHELEHVRRRDNLTAAVHTALRTLFWFHPLVWWLERRTLAERERACDDRAVALCREPRLYARSLAKVVRFGLERPLAGVSAATASDLRRRIEQISAGRPPARLHPLGRAAVAAAVALLVVGSVAATGRASCQAHTVCRVAQVKLHPAFDPSTPPEACDLVPGIERAVPPPPSPCPNSRQPAAEG